MAASRNRLSNNLLNRVGDFVTTRTAQDEPVAVGLSGGCDSVVLLHLLTSLKLGARLSAVHIHHGLSPNADHWADFCSQICLQLKVQLQVVKVSVERQSGLGIEAAARAARYEAFAQSGITTLFLAHHQGDQAETLLFNLLRGAGVAGAAAIAEERQRGHLRLLRPLLAQPRLVLEDYARANHLAWIEDESNDDTTLTRNFLRHSVLTVMNQRFPAAEQNLAQATRHFAEAALLLDELAAADWQIASDGDALQIKRLRTLSMPRIKNLLRFRLRQLAWQAPSSARLDEFVRQLINAAPDRHPELKLSAGSMRVAKGQLHWFAEK
jgi:tRNA(Ile)-lysidine synthase